MNSQIDAPAPSNLASDRPQFALSDPSPGRGGLNILMFADRLGPSQSIAFVEGLARARRAGRMSLHVVEQDSVSHTTQAITAMFETVAPDLVIVSRMDDPALWKAVRSQAALCGAPILFHIDDDLLAPPLLIGIERYRRASQPRRIHTLYDMLEHSDLTLAATTVLADRLRVAAGHDRVVSMKTGCAGRLPDRRLLRGNTNGLSLVYMASASHGHDLATIAPVLNRVLPDYPHVRLTLFGTIAKQPAAATLAVPWSRADAVGGDYMAFRSRLNEMRPDIGLAPLLDAPFNRAKTATKWAEYAEAGAAVLASRTGPYMALADTGALAAVWDDEWEAGLRQMIESPELRERLVRNADQTLRDLYGWERLEDETVSVIEALCRRKEMAA